MHKVPQQELANRMARFRSVITAKDPNWEIAYIITKINIFYFTGTMQDGVLVIPRNDDATLWVRVSYERATDESLFPNIKPMRSYRYAAAAYPSIPTTAYIEKEFLPIGLWERFAQYFPTKNTKAIGPVINQLRWKKSDYELEQIRTAGRIHQQVLEVEIPKIFQVGMTEVEMSAEVYRTSLLGGHNGVSRFSMFGTQMITGQISIGDNALYPTHFDGPGGNMSYDPAAPFIGTHRKLQKSDLIFIDSPININGYHTDKTMIYSFGAEPTPEMIREHKACVEIKNRVAEQLKPGVLPMDIYNNIINSLSPEFLKNFMGYGKRQVKFLGHGIGLFIDEMPVIADKFNMPIEEGMCFAVEPKKGIEGIGMVGVEETFIVTKNGAECITTINNDGLIVV